MLLYKRGSPVGKTVSSEECEIEGILLGIEKSIDHMKGNLSFKPGVTVFIFL